MVVVLVSMAGRTTVLVAPAVATMAAVVEIILAVTVTAAVVATQVIIIAQPSLIQLRLQLIIVESVQ